MRKRFMRLTSLKGAAMSGCRINVAGLWVSRLHGGVCPPFADYVRISGTQWVDDPEQRFATTLDLREPLLLVDPKLEATITDDLPRHFQAERGQHSRNAVISAIAAQGSARSGGECGDAS